MELFVQQVLGAVSLNQHVDETHEYHRCFSAWVARRTKKWAAHNVLPAAVYHDKLQQQGKDAYLLETREGFTISDNILPWLIFACHVLLGYTKDVEFVSQLLSHAGFQKLPKQLISETLAWSSYPARLGTSSENKEFCHDVFTLLEKSEPGFSPFCKSGYIKQTWQLLYDSHLRNPLMNPMLNEGGIVYFALVRIDKNVYSLLFVDGMTEAVEFSHLITTYRDFSNPEEFDSMARDITACLCAFLNTHGHPRYMVVVNPLTNWLHYVLKRAVEQIYVATHTQFVAPVEKDDDNVSILRKVEPVISAIASVLAERNIEEIPPFRYLKSQDSSWKITFATNVMWAQNQSFHCHPQTVTSVSEPELVVASVPCLELTPCDTTTYRLLKTKPPKRFATVYFPLDPKCVLNDHEVFEEVMRISKRFSLSSGHDGSSIFIDDVTKKVLVYMYELMEAEKRGKGFLTRNIFYESQVKFKNLNEDDLFWMCQGVEITKRGDFRPADETEKINSKLLDPTDRGAPQIRLGHENELVKDELTDPEFESDEEFTVENLTLQEESLKQENEDNEGEVIESLPRRARRRAAEAASAKVKSAYERYKKTRSGFVIDTLLPEENVIVKTTPTRSPKRSVTVSPMEGTEESRVKMAIASSRMTEDSRVKRAIASSRMSQPRIWKKRAREVLDGEEKWNGMVSKREEKTCKIGRSESMESADETGVAEDSGDSVDDIGEDQAVESTSTEEQDGENSYDSMMELDGDTLQETNSLYGGFSPVESITPTKRRKVDFAAHFGQLRDLSAMAENMNGDNATPGPYTEVEHDEPTSQMLAEPASQSLVEHSNQPPPEYSSPPFEEADVLLVVDEDEEDEEAAATININGDPAGLDPAVKAESESPELFEDSPDVSTEAIMAQQFAHVHVSDAYPVLRMIDGDVRRHPDTEYSSKPVKYRGSQYPDGELGYSSDNDLDYLSSDDYSASDFGPEYLERMKQRQEQTTYREEDFKVVLESEADWPLMEPGDLDWIYDILKRRSGDD